MKNFLVLIILAFLFVHGNAQNPKNKDAVTFSTIWSDYVNPNGGDLSDYTNFRYGWNFTYNRNINKFFNLGIPLRMIDGRLKDSIRNSVVFGGDIIGQLQAYKEGRTVIPYLLAGVGYHYNKDAGGDLQIPVGIGTDIKILERGYLNLKGEYRFSTTEDRNNIILGVGLKYLFGKGGKTMDMDGDGIADTLDQCPDVFGSMALKGCPDKDNDGIADFNDQCPDVFGSSSANGCPDKDGDGIADKDDKCPNEKGTIANMGCPTTDSDNDGIDDINDKCPNVPGSKSSMGCPDADEDGVADIDDECPDIVGLKVFNGCPDSDGDGIEDRNDKCPNVFGSKSNRGCPEIKSEDREKLEFAMQAVQFELGKTTLKSESLFVLDDIAGIMKRYPDYSLKISGHTDPSGKRATNLKLSENRAKACYNYLVSKGISTGRMSYTGYGPDKPRYNNNTPEGQKLNRRTEFEMYLD